MQLFSGIIQEFRSSFPHPAWYRQDTIAGYQKLMSRFYNGELKSTAWHGGPLEKESFSILSFLKDFNRSGLIPFDSQPGQICLEGELPIWKQRAYVNAFCVPELGHKLLELNQVSNIKVATIPNHLKQKRKVRDGLSHLWEPGDDSTDGDLFAYPASRDLNSWIFTPKARKYLRSLVTVSIVDMTWGENRMWDLVKNKLAA